MSNRNLLGQLFKLCSITLVSLPYRISGSFVAIFSIACVTAVLLSVLTLINGMNKTMEKSGLDNTLIVMRAGSMSELQSVLFPVEVGIILDNSDIVRDDKNRPIHSAEMFVNVETRLANSEKLLSLALRGVSSSASKMRPEFKLEAGEYFKSGLRQVVIGQAIARKNPQLRIGDMITLGGSEWQIVGVFSDNHSVFESEIWADLHMVQNDYQRGNTIQSVRVLFKDGVDVEQLQETWKKDPRLNIRVITERKFFAQQSESVTRLMRWLGIPLALVMAAGAIVAALNTMYAATVNRISEIGVQKAIGFSPAIIALSVVFESFLLAIIGGALGILPLYFGLDGVTTATNNSANLSQIMFNFTVSPILMLQALAIAVGIGVLGGILPAIHAIRIPVTRAIRLI